MKYITTLILIAAVIPVFGQTFFEAGVKFAYGPTFMYNKNLLDEGTYDHVLTSGLAIGGKLGVTFAGHHGVTVDYMSAKSNQDFDLRGGGTHEYTWKHNDVLLMYRFSGNGAFVEIGPKFSFMSDVTSRYLTTPEADVTPNFVENYKSVVFGFGSYLIGTDVLTIQAGVRLHWALDDMISEEGQNAGDAGYPVHPSVSLSFPTYEKTKDTAGQFMVELNYAFGRFAKASCSQRWRLILFE